MIERRRDAGEHALGRVTVELFADGYVSVKVDPKVGRPVHLRRAADTLARLATTAENEERPLHCPLCGRPVRSIAAKPTGDYELGPCGHSL